MYLPHSPPKHVHLLPMSFPNPELQDPTGATSLEAEQEASLSSGNVMAVFIMCSCGL